MRDLTLQEIQQVSGANLLPDFFPDYIVDDFIVNTATVGTVIGIGTALLLNQFRPSQYHISFQEGIIGTLETAKIWAEYGLGLWAIYHTTTTLTSYFS